MKIFLAYKFTGIDPALLAEKIGAVVKALRDRGHLVWNSLEHQQRYQDAALNNSAIMRDAFKNIDAADALLAFIDSPEKSEGMLVEIGYALAKEKKFFLAIRQDLSTVSISQIADKLIIFNSFDELLMQLKEIV